MADEGGDRQSSSIGQEAEQEIRQRAEGRKQKAEEEIEQGAENGKKKAEQQIAQGKGIKVALGGGGDL